MTKSKMCALQKINQALNVLIIKVVVCSKKNVLEIQIIICNEIKFSLNFYSENKYIINLFKIIFPLQKVFFEDEELFLC